MTRIERIDVTPAMMRAAEQRARQLRAEATAAMTRRVVQIVRGWFAPRPITGKARA